jgi:DMSO/TMAO reductase YedYZ molybdopterin-dependent catalytic subunit
VGGVLAARGGTTVTSAASGGDGGTDGEPADPTVEALLSAAAERTFTVEGLDPLVSEDHYVVDIASVDPDLLAGSWSLSITGAVDDVTTFDYETLLGMDAEHRFVTLRCVGEPLNGEKVDTALWTGVPATALLEEAGVDLDSECCVMLRAADDYYEEFPLAALEDALIAYRMNGGPLPQQHGRPVRALVPGHWGEINVKWLTEIEILEREQDGFWEKKGWHGTGPVNTVAKLHSVRTPGEGRVRLAGHAYAGTRGVSRVEVSTDGGESWTDAELTERLPGRVPADAGPDAVAEAGEAADAWRMWRHEYTADGPHDVVVRAVEADGTVQPSEEADAFPSGATGWVSERVRP